MTIVPVTSPDLDASEVSWFSGLCSDDYQFLGVPDGDLRPSWEHCRDIVLTAEAQGFSNILAPSSYQVDQETLSFVAGMASLTDRINMLPAIRCGEMQPIMLARTVATLNHMMKGRLTLNVISSDFPGEVAESSFRYQHSHEVVEILKQALTQDKINYVGQVNNFKGVSTAPATPFQTGGPMLYFGGYLPAALDLCGQHCDVHLMWPEPEDKTSQCMRDVNAVAEKYDRTLDYGLRVHMIVRDTEAEARELAGKFGYVETGLWTGVRRVRSGCGAALSDPPIKSSAKSKTTAKWAFTASSSRVTRISTRQNISANLSCQT